ncbi:hypothetical protein MPL3356_60336 [Mesorhizobium plurifarium]|uniref:Uncharacterized protein n=1 Tax=Mesorhizobium plurifarium TaxID=69974 RepID=A0A090E8Z9_MESPL|nr:hypothetical protein MPL3356_60336 [Mesorhizobium plurifarium]
MRLAVISLSPDIVQRAVFDAGRQEHQAGTLRRRSFETLAIIHVEFRAMPLADKSAVLAVQRSAEMQADIGRRADAVAAAPDMNLAAKEGRDQAAGLRDIGDLADFMFHRRTPYRCNCIYMNAFASIVKLDAVASTY